MNFVVLAHLIRSKTSTSKSRNGIGYLSYRIIRTNVLFKSEAVS